MLLKRVLFVYLEMRMDALAIDDLARPFRDAAEGPRYLKGSPDFLWTWMESCR